MEYQQLLHFYRTYRERLQIQGKIIGKQFKGVCYLFNSGFVWVHLGEKCQINRNERKISILMGVVASGMILHHSLSLKSH